MIGSKPFLVSNVAGFVMEKGNLQLQRIHLHERGVIGVL